MTPAGCALPDRVGEPLLDTIRTVARGDADNTAAWWQQDAIGGRTAGDTSAAARRVLAGIDNGDPAVLDTLPTAADSGPGDAYATSSPAGAAPYRELCRLCRNRIEFAYEQAFTDRLADAIGEHCQQLPNP
ncbi:hypothetical protein GCM10010123_19680 [Pilimelia anulata]|uniref:Uncharacterized protein n=1 Tax=Pilimelia anulata TaxID=53371 RepID=A0A8J3BA93_9ACTN|nr:hypothetical protein [Pilimelia anulata]GGJ89919.1 hypothetical protein GCM10010123_19680 [Pilimelia anulata]